MITGEQNTHSQSQGEWGSLAVSTPLSKEEIEEKARRLLAQMTLDEKIGQMSGDTPRLSGMIQMWRGYNVEPIPAGENTRLGIPAVRFTDGPRGVVMYHSTCFPVSMARGASWDVELEERIGDAIGVEARAQGANFFGGVCINLLRHPAWGRAQETYGEDPYHLGEMGAALVRGVQRHVMACAKHYALNSMENARFKVDARASQRTLHEIYLPHFKRCVDEGVASVMSAYNKVNGEYCGHNAHLLRDILKKEWGFEGFVVSDFIWGVRETKAATLGGLDIEMPFTQWYGKRLKKLVQQGDVPETVVDEAVLRILRQKMRFAQVGEPGRYTQDAVVGAAHRDLARQAAQKSMVLLKNESFPASGKPLLPVDLGQVKSIAMIGKLADTPNTGDLGSSAVRPPYVVTPLEGLRTAVSSMQVLFDDGAQPEQAARLARQADLAILIAGYTNVDEGEYLTPLPFFPARGGDRDSLALSPHDEALIQAVAAAQPNTAVVMMGGSAIIMEAWRERVPAILMAWYPGMEGGHALADILLGKVNPSGKLPCVFPKSPSQLPYFDKNANAIEYGYYHGYRLMDKNGEEPAFSFGFGLSYTSFAYSDLKVSPEKTSADGSVRVSVDITNTGQLAGEEVAQLYVGYPASAVDRPRKELKGFARVAILPGETRQVAFELPAQRLAYYDEENERWAVEAGEYVVYAGPSSSERDLLSAKFRLVV
jgi:beta-glucosidase